MFWIISGPSSVGKSTFLASPRCQRNHRASARKRRCITPTNRSRPDAPSEDCLLHYNFLRRARQLCRERRAAAWFRRLISSGFSADWQRAARDFGADPCWARVRALSVPKQARGAGGGASSCSWRGARNAAAWRRIWKGKLGLCPAPVAGLLRAHRSARFLPRMVRGTLRLRDCFSPRRCARSRVSPPSFTMSTPYTREADRGYLAQGKIRRITASSSPTDLRTPGQDRSATRDLDFPQLARGAPVLDVGCALGYFCFEAERRRARRVLGVELNPERLRQARRLQKILASRCEFEQRDVLGEPVGGDFRFRLSPQCHPPSAGARPRAAHARGARLANDSSSNIPTFADPRFRKSTAAALPVAFRAAPADRRELACGPAWIRPSSSPSGHPAHPASITVALRQSRHLESPMPGPQDRDLHEMIAPARLGDETA